MKDYFTILKDYVKNNYLIVKESEKLTNIKVIDVFGSELDNNVRFIYEHYSTFRLLWSNKENKYIGTVDFVSYEQLNFAHDELVSVMNECYDINEDEEQIVQDILNWYPLFWFTNGDAFCLDIRNGTVVFYEHEVYDSGKNLHSLLIADSINNLFEKWSQIHFADVYYWDDVVNDNGIDFFCDLIKKYL